MSLPYEPAKTLADHLLETRVVTRIWDRDISVWNAAARSEAARSIGSRLGWLDAAATMKPRLEEVEALGEAVREEGIASVYLLGMGGSSLCAEVITSVLARREGSPQLHVLDTTDELTITTAAGRLDPARSLFIVASKSGGTVEVASLERFFWARMWQALGPGAGRHFVAITDPGTALQTLAESRGYRAVFLNPPDIGGRFSALSLFGLVPAALAGASPRELHEAGAIMADGCRQENHANAGLELGAFIGAATRAGRDKLTLVLPSSLATLGLWIEQLVAESTGKRSTGALPVVDEPLGRPDEYGGDRAFVSIATDVDAPDADRLEAIEGAGHPVLRLTTRLDGLGAEFFRWEFATAVAGAALGINPFDEPNVAEAKDQTRSLLAAYASARQLPGRPPRAASSSVEVHAHAFTGGDPASIVRAAIDSLRPGDYVAFLSYLPADASVERAVAEVRGAIRAKARVATTFGVGPRYLHSTGQYHKGGPDTALAFVLTADDETDTRIPDADYSFSVLKRAQALGDTATLEAHGRRAVRLHIRSASPAAAIEELFAEALR
jgi:glucose-6-phosphate isomerase